MRGPPSASSAKRTIPRTVSTIGISRVLPTSRPACAPGQREQMVGFTDLGAVLYLRQEDAGQAGTDNRRDVSGGKAGPVVVDPYKQALVRRIVRSEADRAARASRRSLLAQRDHPSGRESPRPGAASSSLAGTASSCDLPARKSSERSGRQLGQRRQSPRRQHLQCSWFLAWIELHPPRVEWQAIVGVSPFWPSMDTLASRTDCSSQQLKLYSQDRPRLTPAFLPPRSAPTYTSGAITGRRDSSPKLSRPASSAALPAPWWPYRWSKRRSTNRPR